MVQKYLIEKPDPSKVNKQKAIELLDKEGSLELINKLNTPRYLYWDKVKHKKCQKTSLRRISGTCLNNFVN